MDAYVAIKMLHIIGATVLLGTGAGIAFFMLMAHQTGKPDTIAAVARIVVIADYVFTATAVVAQPATGVLLAMIMGYSLTEPWIVISLVLYAVTGAFWLPVVWMQTRMRKLAETASVTQTPLPAAYHKLFKAWFACGVPAFLSVLTIVWLMIARPSF